MIFSENNSDRLQLLFLTSFRMLIVSFFIMTVVHQFYLKLKRLKKKNKLIPAGK